MASPIVHQRGKLAVSQSSPAATGIKAQYAAQVAADLEHNTKEQERIGAEIAALDEQLRILQRDHALLVTLQQAVSSENAENLASTQADEAATAPAHAPAQRRTRSTPSGRKKAQSAKAEQDGKESQAKKAKKSTSSSTPTLVTLVREHLADHPEPRSAAEITAVLTQSHPDRDIKATAVRTTAEGLVAKGLVQRTKQGSSVFYASAPTIPAQPEKKVEPAAV